MDMTLLISAFGCVLGLGLLMVLAYRGTNPVFSAPFCALIVAAISRLNVTDAMLTTFAGGFANMLKTMAFTLLTAAMMARCLAESGSTRVIAEWVADTFGAERVCWAVVIAVVILTYGGMGWGGLVTVFPIGHYLCSKSNINRDILVGCMIFGAWTFAMTSPFSPTPHNAMLMAFFGTGPSAGMIPGLATALFMFFSGCFYLDWQAKRWRKHGKVFDTQHLLDAEEEQMTKYRPHLIVAFLPIIITLFLFNVVLVPIPGAMVGGAISCIILNFKAFDNPKQWFKIVNEGCGDSVLPIINLSIMGGFGTVVALTPFFQWVISNFEKAGEWMNPYVLAVLGSYVSSFLVGSASGSIALSNSTIGPVLMKFAQQGGYDLGNMHRLVCMASDGFDSLPHNGSLISINTQFGTENKNTYWPVFVVATIIPLIGVSFVALPLALLGFK